MRTPMLLALLLSAASCLAKAPPPKVPTPVTPKAIERIDAQEVTIANLRVQMVQQALAQVQNQMREVAVARQKVLGHLYEKYQMQEGDDYDPETLAIKRVPHRMAAVKAPAPPGAPGPQDPPKHVTPAPFPHVPLPPVPQKPPEQGPSPK